MNKSELYHHGIQGMKWGVRRYQNKDGSLTAAGRNRYGVGPGLHADININAKGSVGSTSGGGGAGGLDDEDEKKLDEDLKRMDDLLQKRIDNNNFEYKPLIEDDSDVNVYLLENGIDPDKLSASQFASAKRKFIEWDNKKKRMLKEAEVEYEKERKKVSDNKKNTLHKLNKNSGIKVQDKGKMNINHSNTMSESELYHYGILGMKWGVRRYQNYDGSYTQKGLARYRDNENRYNSAKKAYQETERNTLERSKAKRELKESKRKLKESYKHLKKDYIADKGKDLYKSGKTITDNNMKANTVSSLIAAGGSIATHQLLKKGDIKMAAVSAATTSLGIGVVQSITANQNKKLRAYYAHTQWKG